jgi:hypothetical protein
MACLALGLVAFALANAAPSFAYDPGAGLVNEPGGGTTLSYVAGAEANNVTLEQVNGNYVLTDSGVVNVLDADGAAGCTVTVPSNQATCPETGVTKIRVELRDGGDTLVVNPSIQTPALVFGGDGSDNLTGGSGNDTINARGGGPDTVQCGAGTDSAGIEADDLPTDCELVDLPPETALVPGPARTADATPDFTFSSNEDPNVTFQCSLDGGVPIGCSSPFTSPALADGSHTFQVRASDSFGPDPTAVSSSFEVDTLAPDTAIDSGPPAESDSTSANISFVSHDPDAVAFECKLDAENWRTCKPPASYSGLAVGTHVFSVRAVDDVGNVDPTEATVSFKVTSKPVSASGPPTGLIVVRPPASFVLIGGTTIRVSRDRVARVTLNCSGTRDCAGELTLTTAKKIRIARKRRGSRSRRRYVRLGAATFFIPAPRSLTVKIPLTKRAFRIVKKRKRIKTMITVTDRDRVGRTRISTREVFLKARK